MRSRRAFTWAMPALATLLGIGLVLVLVAIGEDGEHYAQRTEFVDALLDYAFYFAHYGDIAYCYGRFPA